jgi:hypothetical protein
MDIDEDTLPAFLQSKSVRFDARSTLAAAETLS